MPVLAICLILFAGQLNTLQPKPVVHLQPHKNSIEVGFDGSLLELINAPPIIHLPKFPPKPNAHGGPWFVEVKNMGPASVTITNDTTHFETPIRVGQTVQIKSSGSEYLLKR
ncbi:MAG: hypothetical protein LUO89_00805 [Methanothrix sp.]|nr:hypothetical protein [Methanothrix sp.]